MLEVYTDFEGNEFIIEKLPHGSVLNYRGIFNGDYMHTNVRALNNTHLRELTLDKLNEIKESDQKFKNKLTMWENHLLRIGHNIPLDYIVGSINKSKLYK